MAWHSFGPLSHVLVDYHLERGGIPLHDAVGESVNGAQLLKIKAEVLCIWAKGVCVFDDCVCKIRLDMTTSP